MQNPSQNQIPKPKRNSPEYYLANKEHIRQQQKEYRVKNKEKLRLLRQSWREQNRHKEKEYRQKDLFLNPDLVRARKAAYKRRLKNQMPKWVNKQEILKFYLLAQQQGLSVDHIIPLKGKLISGLHVPWNLQLMSIIDNSRKNNKFLGD